MASLVGLGLVVVFMLVYYKLSGINAIVAMAINLLVLLALMAYFGATMTLPGIAGFILTIGMGVDSNVLIFERIKEELAARQGRPGGGRGRLRPRLPDDSRHPRRVAHRRGVPLPVRHRARSAASPSTLTIGLLINVFTSVFVSRTLFELELLGAQVARRSASRRRARGPVMQIFKNANYDFIRWRWHALVLSSAVIIGGFLLMLARGGMPLGIDFTGGTHRRREVRAAGAEDAVRTALDVLPGEKVVQQYGDAGAARDPDPLPAGPGRGAGLRLEASSRKALDALRRRPTSAKFEVAQHRGGRAGRRAGPPAEGHLRDDRVDRRPEHLHRAPVPVHLRGRRDRRDVPRHLRRARDARASSATSCR